MDELEKLDKLRERANVSYEEAKEALTISNGDLLDAIVYLEKSGKVSGPANETYSTSAAQNMNTCQSGSGYDCSGSEAYNTYKNYREGRKQYRQERQKNFADRCKRIWKKLNENNFVVKYKGDVVIDVPVWVFLLIVIVTFEVSLIVMIVAMFFDCRYSIEGKADVENINKCFDGAENVVDDIKNSFK